MEASEKAIQVYVPPNALARGRDIFLQECRTKLFASIELGLPNTWQHRAAQALQVFLVQTPLSSFQFEQQERVAQFFEGLQGPLPKQSFGLPIQQPQIVSNEVLNFAGHYQTCAMHHLRHAYQRQGQSLQIFEWNQRWYCFAKVFLSESQSWPDMTKRPTKFHTVRKIAIGPLYFTGSVANEPSCIRVHPVRPCVSPSLIGNQNRFWPWTDHPQSLADGSQLVFLNMSENVLQPFIVHLKDGLCEPLDHRVPIQLNSEQTQFVTTLIPVPSTPQHCAIVECKRHPGRDIQQCALFFDLSQWTLVSESLRLPWIERNQKPTSLAGGNFESFQMGLMMDNLSCFVRRILWKDLVSLMRFDSQVKVHVV